MFSYFLISCAIILIVSQGVGLAHANIRSDIAELKSEINSLEDLIDDLASNIVSQKDEIKAKEKALSDAKAWEKQKRNEIGDSWTSWTEHEEAQADLNQAEINLRDAKAQLQIYIDQRNEALQKITLIEDEIDRLDALPPENKPPGKLIGITLDKSCLTQIANFANVNCPTWAEIEIVFPGIDCNYPGHLCLDWYKQAGNGKGYIINPNAEIMERIDIVEIRSNFEEYHLKGKDGYNATGHELVYNLGRYVERCEKAYIDASQWLTLLGDSIMYLDSNCSKTYHTPQRFESLNRTEHDITTSYKWQLEEWIKQSKELCREKCFEY